MDRLTPLAFSGIHVISPSLFPCFDEMPERFGIIDFYLKWCSAYPLKGLKMENLRLVDVGKLDTLSEAENFISKI
jgi:NDP-sugar pyrophosphorylase family protein